MRIDSTGDAIYDSSDPKPKEIYVEVEPASCDTKAIVFAFRRQTWETMGPNGVEDRDLNHPVTVPYQLHSYPEFVIAAIANWDGGHYTLNVYDTFNRPDKTRCQGWHHVNDNRICPIDYMDSEMMEQHTNVSYAVYVRKSLTEPAVEITRLERVLEKRGHRVALQAVVDIPCHQWSPDNYLRINDQQDIIRNLKLQFVKLTKTMKKMQTDLADQETEEFNKTQLRRTLRTEQKTHEDVWKQLRAALMVFIDMYTRANNGPPKTDFLSSFYGSLRGVTSSKTLPAEDDYIPLYVVGENDSDSDYDPTKDNDTESQENEGSNTAEGAGVDDEDSQENEDRDSNTSEGEGAVPEENEVEDEGDTDDIVQEVGKACLAQDASDDIKQQANDDGNKVLDSIITTIANLCDDSNFDVTVAHMDESSINKVVEAYSRSDDQSAGKWLYIAKAIDSVSKRHKLHFLVLQINRMCAGHYRYNAA